MIPIRSRTYLISIKILICLYALIFISSASQAQTQRIDVHTAIKKFTDNFKISKKFRQFNTEQELIFNKNSFIDLQNYQDFTNISEQCSSQMQNFINGLKNNSEWSLNIIDSYGKPPSGILDGALIWPGDYKECVNTMESSIMWKSKYCSLTNKFASNSTENYFFQLAFKYGVCMPMECSETDISSIFNQLLDFDGYIDKKMSLYQDIVFDPNDVICHYDKEFDINSKIAIGFFAAFSVIIAIGTVFDIIKLYIRRVIFLRESRTITFQFTDDSMNLNEETQNLIADITEKSFFSDESILSKLLSNFSMYSNSIKVFKKSTEASRLRCLHAIRVISLSWVILGHTYGFIPMFSDNIRQGSQFIKRFSFSIITNGFFSVDNFFILSGLLTSYKFIKEMSRPDVKFTFGFMIKYYLHRIWRIIPTYICVMTLTVMLSKYLGSGPFFPLDGFEPGNNCAKYWWTNVLFVNNFLKQDDMCFSISWYLANDMQFHWLAPLILIPIVFKKKILGSIIGCLFLLANIFSIAFILNANPDSELGVYGPKSEVFLDLIYNKPWGRIGPFVIGLFLGWIILNQESITLKPIHRILIWIASLVILCLCLFLLYPDFKHFPTFYYGRGFHIFYQSISRICWAIGIGCIIFACGISKGKLINRILTFRCWIPLSRLSYSAYLIHCSVIIYLYSTQDRAMHIQDINMIYYFMGNWVFSYAAAFLVTTCIELPFIGLEKLIFNSK